MHVCESSHTPREESTCMETRKQIWRPAALWTIPHVPLGTCCSRTFTASTVHMYLTVSLLPCVVCPRALITLCPRHGSSVHSLLCHCNDSSSGSVSLSGIYLDQFVFWGSFYSRRFIIIIWAWQFISDCEDPTSCPDVNHNQWVDLWKKKKNFLNFSFLWICLFLFCKYIFLLFLKY